MWSIKYFHQLCVRLVLLYALVNSLDTKKVHDAHFAAHCRFSVGNHSDCSVDVADLEVLLIVINKLAISKDQNSHSLSLMSTGEDRSCLFHGIQLLYSMLGI